MNGKKILAAFTGLVMAAANTIYASAAVPEGAFDAGYYASVYTDLGAAFGNDAEALYSHYLQFGIAEGRFGSPDFDVRVYREQYQDLEDAFGEDWDAYFWHYLNLGANEGRTAAADGAPAPVADTPQTDDMQAGRPAPQPGSTIPGQGDIPQEGTAADPKQEGYFDDTLAQDAFNAVNQYRIDNGMTAYSWNDSLYEAAKVRAKETAESFSHTRPDGQSCFTALNAQGISYRYAGENIAAGQPTGQSVATAWYNSEGHKKNMLSTKFTNAAVACYVEDQRCYWVNFFAD